MFEKLTITKCTVSGQQVTAGSEKFSAIINPEKYEHSHTISYEQENMSDPKPIGNPGTTTKFKNVAPETISFSIIMDGTGVVREKLGQIKPTKVSKQIEDLKKIVYDYDGTKHEPNVVQLSWGDGLSEFKGRLTSLKINYTLFNPMGEPLRANLSLSFVSFNTQGGVAVKADKQSPDMTHHVIVRAGDTLPLLCKKIYDDPGKYLEIARLNNLDGFRNLSPGTELFFPPMR